MAFHKAYMGAYLAVLFPKLADLYERVAKKEIPYRNNALIFAKFPERESSLNGARLKFIPKSGKLEQKAETA